MMLCALATTATNLVVLLASRFVPRPMSPTVTLSLSLAATDAFSSLVIFSSLMFDSFLPKALGIPPGRHFPCFSLFIEVSEFGGDRSRKWNASIAGRESHRIEK